MVTLIKREKPSVGMGPITAPSVQHVCPLHAADPVPVALFHDTSPGSSAWMSVVGGELPARPVLVKPMLSFFPLGLL